MNYYYDYCCYSLILAIPTFYAAGDYYLIPPLLPGGAEYSGDSCLFRVSYLIRLVKENYYSNVAFLEFEDG